MKRLISILSLMFILVGTISAEGEYGDYDRPSIFPDFEEPTKYPNNMSCMLYVRNINGQYVSNYEVAAYDQNGFLHAVNRSSKSKDTGNDCCVLTISGEEGDTLDFMVIYGDFEQPTKVWAVETLPFETNAEIGRDPLFVLTLSETPSVLYWTGNPTSATPTGSVPLDRIKAGMLKDARRISLKGTWNKRSVSDLLDGCKSLLYVDMESIPDTTAGAFTDSNPNCLKFLPDGTTEAPEGWTNCIADENPNDINLLKRITTVLDKKDCTDSKLFLDASKNLYALEPSPEAAYNIGVQLFKDKKYGEAATYFEQATKAENNDRVFRALRNLAMCYQNTGNLSKGRDAARRAAQVDPTAGEPYLIIAMLYAESSKQYESSTFGGKEVFWAAVDKCERARQLDPSVAKRAGEMIAAYRQYYPSTETVFFNDYQDGQSYSIGGWIGETTTIRTKK